MILGLDFETYSALDIRCGSAAYAEHETTGVHCAVFVQQERRGGPSQTCRWTPDLGDLPTWVVDHIEGGHPVLAHNVGFEQSMIHYVLAPHFGWPEPKLDQWRDTAANAAVLALPTSLGGLGAAIGASVIKDEEGHALMLSLCKSKFDSSVGLWLPPTPTVEQLDRLILYCERDVLSMLDCWWRLPEPPSFERDLMRLDRRINVHGVRVDLDFIGKLSRMAKAREKDLGAEVFALTNDLVSTKSLPAVKAWLVEQGVTLPQVKRANGTVSTGLNRETASKLAVDESLDPFVCALLEARIEAGRATSLAKLDRAPSMVNADGRLRYALRYCGAHTGRWSSSGLQVHNMPKSKLKPEVAAKLRALVFAGDMVGASALTPNLLESLSWLLRSVLVAAPGHDLIGGDFSAIEARVLAWLAGEQGVLDLFATGADVYTVAATRVGSTDRQLGKVQVLALGYGMGPRKFAVTAASYGIKLPLKEALRVQRLWRASNPSIVQFWLDLEAACRDLTAAGEGSRTVGRLTVHGGKRCLRVELPSGRCLHYWRPSVVVATRKVETVNEDGEPIERELTRPELRYFTESKSRKGMQQDHSYGGKLAENVTQAVARDLLGEALLRLDPLYPVVLHVHDSIASEVPAGTGAVSEFCALMAEQPSWARGLPLKVDGYRGKHFKG